MSQRPTIYNLTSDVQTSGTTPTLLQGFTTSTDQSYAVYAEVTGVNRGGTEGGSYFLAAAFKNIGGTLTQIGATEHVAGPFEDDADWNATITTGVLNDGFHIEVTGGTGDTVDWTCSMKILVSQG